MCKYYIMTQTIKVRKNKLNTRRHMKGGDMEEGMKVFIAGLELAAKNKFFCVSALVSAKKFALPTFIKTIPDDNNTNDLIKGLGINATLKELIETSLRTITCKDIGIIATVLPKLLVFDKIQELLNAPNEADKKGTEFYKTLHNIITDPKNQDLACRVLTAFKDKKYITDEHIKLFSNFIVGKENVCEGGVVSNISETANNLWATLSGKKTDDSTENTNDKRCGENLLVKKSMFVGEYCAPPAAPAAPAKEDQLYKTATDQSSEPATDGKPDKNPPDLPYKTATKADVTESTKTAKTDETRAAEPATVGGKRQKYKRVNKSKKNKKSKSNKSKRSNK